LINDQINVSGSGVQVHDKPDKRKDEQKQGSGGPSKTIHEPSPSPGAVEEIQGQIGTEVTTLMMARQCEICGR
jgi:hypothetical protein